jgi:RNA polymerase sigma-54 factor
MTAPVPRLELRQSTALAMTPQMQQSIRLLQLPSLEVMQYVADLMEQNPLLSEEAPESSPAPEETALSAMAEETGETEDEAVTLPDEPPADRLRERKTQALSTSQESFIDTLASPVSLREHLENQLWCDVADPKLRLIVQYLIGLIDEAGYIREDAAFIQTQLRCDAEELEEAFQILHGFDPGGIGARDLSECLAIQLRDRHQLDHPMKILLLHLDQVASGDARQLARHCGVSEAQAQRMCARLRRLNPRPASAFLHEPLQSIVPDIFLKPLREGWRIELNPATQPHVLVDRRYHAELKGKAHGKEERQYLSERLLQANWLMRALDSRAGAMLKVATEIASRQDRFFREGVKYLTPLTLKQVAGATGLHESTVSRVVSHKFMATPCGIYELKYFFAASLASDEPGVQYSNKTVQHLIKEMVARETPDMILSDEAICRALQEKGVTVARRTVAKYRELLHIPTSAERRKRSGRR